VIANKRVLANVAPTFLIGGVPAIYFSVSRANCKTSDCKNFQSCRLHQPPSMTLRAKGAHDTRFRDWIAAIHEHGAPAERIPANMTTADGQEHSEDVDLVGPKMPAASGRCVG
jgi:hypothetical protein